MYHVHNYLRRVPAYLVWMKVRRPEASDDLVVSLYDYVGRPVATKASLSLTPVIVLLFGSVHY